jgi:hypothetical protein
MSEEHGSARTRARDGQLSSGLCIGPEVIEQDREHQKGERSGEQWVLASEALVVDERFVREVVEQRVLLRKNP